MSLLEIVTYPDPILHTAGRPVTDEDLETGLGVTVERMFETMYEAGGVGLAAPQVGVSKRFFVMDVGDEDGNKHPQTFINPRVIHIEGEQVGEEGCLSFPGLFQTIKREMRVVVRAMNISGEEFEADLEGLAARCILHETDHCDGIVFIDRVTPIKREIARRKIKRLQQTGEWV
jgi:peptide deformylase